MPDDEWRFAVEDVGDDEQDTDTDKGDADEREERPPLEPGSPSLENTLFVLLGAFVTLFVFVRIAASIGG